MKIKNCLGRFVAALTGEPYTLHRIDSLCARYAALGRERLAILRELEEMPEIVRLTAAYREQGVQALGNRLEFRRLVARALGMPHEGRYANEGEIFAKLVETLKKRGT